ncbi:MAG: DUF2330 domain-containing protein [Minicystis sp.]
MKGNVEIGLSSDALFGVLDRNTSVTVQPPIVPCQPPPGCEYDPLDNFGGAGGYGGAGGESGGVDVVAQSVVGPYETVTLHSTDPNALADWLSSHGYVIQADFAPVVSAYVNEGFDFVALKLVPGKGIKAMRPVRVTTPGAGVGLPLRMVAGGTGARTPITLWIFGEGRYQPANFETQTITEQDLVWDFASSSSNYATLRQGIYDKGDWLVETSYQMYPGIITEQIVAIMQDDPVASGYGDAEGNGAYPEFEADSDRLWGSIQGPLWHTRVSANLPRASLADDLVIGASADQNWISGDLRAKTGINMPPCTSYTCNDGDSATVGSSKGCTVGSASERSAAYAAVVAGLGLLLMRRRRPR